MKLAQKVVLQYYRYKLKTAALVNTKLAAKKAFALFCSPFVKYKGGVPEIFKKKGKAISFKFNGDTIKGFCFGEDGNERILIIHGWESCMYKFDQYIKPLVAQNKQVFCFDAVAHGISEGKRCNAFLYSKLITEIIKRYNGFNGYMAHSLGGMALCLALENGNLPLQEQAKIVLIAPGAEAEDFFKSFFKVMRLSPKVIAAIYNLVYELSGKEISWFSLKRIFPKLKNDLLYFQDKQDKLCIYDNMLPIEAMQLPNVKFFVTEGLGHSQIYRDNKNKRIIFEFLGGQPRRTGPPE
jgi:pimeloyl-ACP methyl ester carboxylesterase